ncbi:YqjK family protein [Zymobacter sp. IVIA_5232.4 C2]|uniref:YqjK family protein n=1 Tax=Zymobacter sp. IVIA_5232.4 C2 TaxID=3394855 RepID=UPI0039C067B8
MSHHASTVKRCSLKQQREQLERRIALERQQFARATQQWYGATAGFDQRMAQLAAWKKPLLVVGGLLLARQLRRSPSKLLRLGKRAVALYAVGRNAHGMLNRLRNR